MIKVSVDAQLIIFGVQRQTNISLDIVILMVLDVKLAVTLIKAESEMVTFGIQSENHFVLEKCHFNRKLPQVIFAEGDHSIKHTVEEVIKTESEAWWPLSFRSGASSLV